MIVNARRRLHRVASRVSAVVLSAVLACSVIASCLVIAEFHDHDCTGEECPVCQLLATAQTVLSSGATPVMTGCASAGLAAMAIFVLVVRSSLQAAETPVTQGVKLII